LHSDAIEERTILPFHSMTFGLGGGYVRVAFPGRSRFVAAGFEQVGRGANRQQVESVEGFGLVNVAPAPAAPPMRSGGSLGVNCLSMT
jgi:hypothetical protein